MRHTDIAIVGGGLAGSAAAAMLGRAGIDAILVDPHEVYPPDFRCEKLDGPQMAILRKAGLAEAALRASTWDERSWVARYGHVVDRRPGDQHGILYDTLVNTIRGEIPAATPVLHAKATELTTGPERQTVQLATGETISARLVVLANGLNLGLRQKLGLTRQVTSPAHSISVGFDVRPVGRRQFDFPALTYYSERPRDRLAYITLFPIGGTMRANLFAYRDLNDPWFRALRDRPQETLYAMWPGLRKLMGDFEVPDFIKVRPVDLYVTEGFRQPGIVLVGDAFATSCPAAGTGARKALTDVERLCNVHIPAWLASPGMGAAKIAAFYADPEKVACDAYSAEKAYSLRSFSIDRAPRWAARRRVKFLLQAGYGFSRRFRPKPPGPPGRPGVAAGSA